MSIFNHFAFITKLFSNDNNAPSTVDQAPQVTDDETPTTMPQTVHVIVETHQQPSTDNGTCKDIVTRNPFLNYMRHYRQHTLLKRATAIARAAAKSWHKLDDIERMPFVLQAMRQQRKRRKRLVVIKPKGARTNVTYIN